MTQLPVLTIFDTMTGDKRPLVTIEPGKIGLYVCGVTVYDLSHIGHARVFVVFDIVTRYMRHRGYDVTFVRNHTDVDDKIIKRAAERGMQPLELAQYYIDQLETDMGRLGCRPPSVAPRVSTHIPEIIAMIEQLIANGNAYEVDGDVYFAVESFEGYGKLSGTQLDTLRAGERVAVDERKKSPFDFALWKSAKPGEIFWESPWGPGRPGWHIECSAMAERYLGPHFDIHGGGKDLVFPHHENEVAQSEGAHRCTFVNTWMHVGLVNVDGEKMSKSLGNFWTIRDVLEAYHPEAIRYFMLSAHYRKPIAYSQANLDLARHRVSYLYRTIDAIAQVWKRAERPAAPDNKLLGDLMGRLHAAMDDDFNTPVGLAVLAEAGRIANELVNTKKIASRPDVLAQLVALETFFGAISDVFGILGGDPATVLSEIRALLARQLSIDEAEIETLIAARSAARAAKDWAEADRVRDVLLEKFIEVMDGPEGTIWVITPPLPDEAALESADA
jgi:cysteinyl-tRNA synthetase